MRSDCIAWQNNMEISMFLQKLKWRLSFEFEGMLFILGAQGFQNRYKYLATSKDIIIPNF